MIVRRCLTMTSNARQEYHTLITAGEGIYPLFVLSIVSKLRPPRIQKRIIKLVYEKNQAIKYPFKWKNQIQRRLPSLGTEGGLFRS